MQAWVDSLAPAVSTAPAFGTPTQTGSFSAASYPASQGLTLSQPTNAGDCVVLGLCFSGATVFTNLSGLGGSGGALISDGIASPAICLYVLYNCSAGQTAMSLTGGGGLPSGDIVWAVFAGVRTASNPVSVHGAQSASPGTSVTASLSVTATGQVYICAFGAQTAGGTWTTPAPTNGNAWSLDRSSTGQRSLFMFNQVTGGTGASACTSTFSSSDQLRAQGATLIQAP